MKLKYLVISDVHLGHKTNKVDRMFNAICNYFNNNSILLKDIDILFIAGDLFDNYLANYSHEYLKAIEVMTGLINWCKETNTKLRILEGTPSHDWRQSSVVSNIVRDLKIDIDYKYIDTLHIEHMEDYGVDVLYVPDQYKPKGEDVYKDVQKLLLQNKLSDVDIAIMHGQFHYQFPRLKLDSSHNEKDYLDIVKHYIHIGHIHTHSTKDRIIAQGSFDRLAHGEEEAKGGVLSIIDTENPDNDEWVFLENKHAMVFKTIDVSKYHNEEILKYVLPRVKSLREGSCLRLILDPLDKDYVKTKSFISNLSKFTTKFQYVDDHKVKIGDSIIEDKTIDAFSITKDNIVDLIKNELEVRNLDIVKHLDILNKYIV